MIRSKNNQCKQCAFYIRDGKNSLELLSLGEGPY